MEFHPLTPGAIRQVAVAGDNFLLRRLRPHHYYHLGDVWGANQTRNGLKMHVCVFQVDADSTLVSQERYNVGDSRWQVSSSGVLFECDKVILGGYRVGVLIEDCIIGDDLNGVIWLAEEKK